MLGQVTSKLPFSCHSRLRFLTSAMESLSGGCLFCKHRALGYEGPEKGRQGRKEGKGGGKDPTEDKKQMNKQKENRGQRRNETRKSSEASSLKTRK